MLIFVLACTVTTKHATRIKITNSLDSIIHVELYPKPAYYYSDSTYRSNSLGAAKSEKSFDLNANPGASKIIFTSDNFSISGQDLLSQVFDSIIIKTNLDTAITIRFSPASYHHYTQNIFTSSSIWLLQNARIDHTIKSEPFGKEGWEEVYRQFVFIVKKDSITKY